MKITCTLNYYLNCFRYFDGDMPTALVNTRTKWGRLKATIR